MLDKFFSKAVLGAAIAMPVTAMLAVGAASAADAPKNLQELIAGAKKEKVLRGMWSASSLGGGKGFRHIVAAINKKYGLNLEAKFTPGPSMTRMIAKTTREVKAGQPASADVVWNNSGGALKSGQVGIMRKMNWLAYLDRQPLKWEGFDPVAPGRHRTGHRRIARRHHVQQRSGEGQRGSDQI